MRSPPRPARKASSARRREPAEGEGRSDAGDESPATDADVSDARAGDAADAADAADADDGLSPYARAVLSDQPIAFYRLDDKTTPTVRDATGKGNDALSVGGIALGAPGAIAGDPSTSMTFNGGNAKITAASLFDCSGTKACSFEAWVKPVKTGADYNVMSKMDQNNSRGWLLYVDETTQLRFSRVDNDGGVSAGMSAQLTKDLWHHVVYTYDGVTLRLYVNANLERSVPEMRAIGPVANPFTVGFNESNQCCWFDGSIDEVAIYDKALAPSRVAEHHRVGSGM